MQIFRQVFLVIVLVTQLSACTIRHMLATDYPQYLAKQNSASLLPQTNKASTYTLTADTQDFKYEFRAAATGLANLWIVEVGKMLDDTLASAAVQTAFGTLQKVSSATNNSDTLIFDLQQYTFKDFGAHITIKISLSHAGQIVFEKIYTQDGKTQGGKMFWGGAFAQKNAVHQSTKQALDEVLHQLITDLNSTT